MQRYVFFCRVQKTLRSFYKKESFQWKDRSSRSEENPLLYYKIYMYLCHESLTSSEFIAMAPRSLSQESSPNYRSAFVAMIFIMALIGLVTCINQQFLAPIKSTLLANTSLQSNTFSTLITFSLFLSYFLMGPLGARSVSNRGYKNTIIRGLIIVSAGIALFELSALLYTYYPSRMIQIMPGELLPKEYFLFLLGSFVCGTGLTFLQASVNPYIIACQVGKTSGVQRQNIAGTANSTMTMIGPLFVTYVLFSGKESSELSIQDILIPMVVLMVVVWCLSFLVSKLSLPHIQGTTASKEERVSLSMPFVRYKHLYLGVVAIFVYVGVEVCIGSNINLFAMQDLGLSYKVAAQLASLYWGTMLVGRLLGSLIHSLSARALLTITSLAAALLVFASMILGNPYLLVAVGLFHSVMWGAIFTLAIERLGIRTSKGTGLLMMGVVGGAILPLGQSVWADAVGTWTHSWILVAIGELYLVYYALLGSKISVEANNSR